MEKTFATYLEEQPFVIFKSDPRYREDKAYINFVYEPDKIELLFTSDKNKATVFYRKGEKYIALNKLYARYLKRSRCKLVQLALT